MVNGPDVKNLYVWLASNGCDSSSVKERYIVNGDISAFSELWYNGKNGVINRQILYELEGNCVEYEKEIFAQYDRQCIRVYQAYNPVIAKEAVALQTFGENFNVNRMTWIKSSFLWLMYRSNWGTKKNQECILAIDIYQSEFHKMLKKAVLTSPDSASYTGSQWEKAFDETTVYCQWDPDRNINGNAINRAAIQMGICQ